MSDQQKSNVERGGWVVLGLIGGSELSESLVKNQDSILEFVGSNLPAIKTPVAFLVFIGILTAPVLTPLLAYLLTPRSFELRKGPRDQSSQE